MTEFVERIAAIDISPFEWNDDGVWCPLCGYHIAAPWNVDDEWQAPESCRDCGFPDFEDGPPDI